MPIRIDTGKLLRQRKQVRNLVQRQISRNIETKQRAGTWDETPIDNSAGTPITAQLTDLDTGDSQSTRTGNQVFVTGIYARWSVTCADTTNLVRIVVYMPKDTDDSMSGIDIHSNIDLDKHTVLFDRLVPLTLAGDAVKVVTFKKKFNKGNRRGVNVRYFSATGTDTSKNAIKLYVVSDSDVASDPLLSGSYRLYFKDA